MANSTSALSKIEELQKQIETLKHQAVEEVKQKLAEAREVVSQLESELAELTGKPREEEESRPRRVRRPSISDEHLRAFVLKAMADHGKHGMNAKELADKVGQDALRVRKFIKGNPKLLKRQGSGPGTKFFLA